MSNLKSGAWLRAEAAIAVESVVTDGKSLDAALASVEGKVGVRDRPLLRMLAYGTLRHHFRLREQVGRLLDRPLKKRDKLIESLLAVGFFQLTDTRVPDHAAVSMTVEAARLLRRPKYAGLINAVLRNKLAMIVWLVLIVLGLIIGVLTVFVGLIIVVPVIGYAVWHGYLDTIDAEAFPRHEVGITSVPRSDPTQI